MHIVDTVYYWARTTPLRPAIVDDSGVVTYARLAQAVEAAAVHFAGNIAERSRPVAISIQTGSKILVTVLGLLRAGFSVVLANKFVFSELAALSANTLVLERDGAMLPGGENIVFNDAWLSIGDTANSKPIPVTRTEGGNILCFTSGTTGRPKVVVCPQSSWRQRVLFPLNSAFFNYERILIVPGLTTSWGLSRAYEALHFGRTVCLAPPGVATLWLANTYDVDVMLVSPKQALELAELQERTTHFPLRALQCLQIGAASIGRDAVQRIKKNLCRNVLMIYGSTEAGVIAAAPYDMIAQVAGAVGYIMPGVDVEIVDSGNRILPLGKEGFVRVRSAVFAANMAAGHQTDQWFYPGDLGWCNDDGMLCIAGRTGDVVNRGGEKLSVTDVENFLLSCPGVHDAGVCTAVEAAGISEVWVGLVLKSTADIAAIRYAIESNAQYKNNIDKIFVVDAIPRGTLGKVQRDELKKALQDVSGRAVR